MLKLWYAGAAMASGLILFAASPARADSSPPVLPGNPVAPPVGDLPLLGGGMAVLAPAASPATTPSVAAPSSAAPAS